MLQKYPFSCSTPKTSLVINPLYTHFPTHYWEKYIPQFNDICLIQAIFDAMTSFSILRSSTIPGHNGGIYAVANGPHENQLFSAGADRFVALWNYITLKQEAFAVKLDSAPYSLRFLDDEQLLCIGNAEGGLHVIDLKTRKESKLIDFHKKGLYGLEYLASQKLLVSVGGEGNVGLWSVPDFSLKLQIPVGEYRLRGLAINANESLLAIGSSNGVLRIFETEFFNEIHTIEAHEGSINCIAFHPSKPVVVTGGKDARLRFWNCKTGAKEHQIEAHNFSIYDLKFSPDGQMAASASFDKTAKIWDSTTFNLIARIEAPEVKNRRSMNCVKWISNDRLILAGDDKLLSLWQINQDD